MIKFFRHKGIEAFFYDGDCRGINAQHAVKLGRILDRLDGSKGPEDMNLPGYKLHKLKGREKGIWSVWVSGNWRVTFSFYGNDAIGIDYLDYH